MPVLSQPVPTCPEPLDEWAQAVVATWRYPGELAVYDVIGPLDPAVTWVVRDDVEPCSGSS